MVQKNSTNGGSKSPKIASRSSKKLFFPTLNAHIFKSILSNFMKFLPHDLGQVKFKILWLDSKNFFVFVFLGKCKKHGNFHCFLTRN